MGVEIVSVGYQLTVLLQAFQNLMNLHILFVPVQAAGTEDATVSSTAVLPLTLDEETQHRCAGFIQAEVERYADEIEELSPPPSEGSDEEADKSGDEEPVANRRKKGKKTTQNRVTSEYSSYRATAILIVNCHSRNSFIIGARVHLHGYYHHLFACDPCRRDTLPALFCTICPLRQARTVVRSLCKGDRRDLPGRGSLQEQRRHSRCCHQSGNP